MPPEREIKGAALKIGGQRGPAGLYQLKLEPQAFGELGPDRYRCPRVRLGSAQVAEGRVVPRGTYTERALGLEVGEAFGAKAPKRRPRAASAKGADFPVQRPLCLKRCPEGLAKGLPLLEAAWVGLGGGVVGCAAVVAAMARRRSRRAARAASGEAGGDEGGVQRVLNPLCEDVCAATKRW